MANQPVSAFLRTFNPRDLFSGPALRAVFWSVAATLLLAGLLVTIGALAALLTEQGSLSVVLTDDEADRFASVTGLRLMRGTTHVAPAGDAIAPDAADREAPAPEREPAATEKSDQPAAEQAPARKHRYHLAGEGIIGPVWRSRDRWYGPAFAWLFRRVELLHDNDFALVTLLVAAISIWLLRAWCLRRIVACSRSAALRVDRKSVV